MQNNKCNNDDLENAGSFRKILDKFIQKSVEPRNFTRLLQTSMELKMSGNFKVMLYKMHYLPIPAYGAETWTWTKKLQSEEIKFQ
jgi:hypothetical protein